MNLKPYERPAAAVFASSAVFVAFVYGLPAIERLNALNAKGIYSGPEVNSAAADAWTDIGIMALFTAAALAAYLSSLKKY